MIAIAIVMIISTSIRGEIVLDVLYLSVLDFFLIADIDDCLLMVIRIQTKDAYGPDLGNVDYQKSFLS